MIKGHLQEKGNGKNYYAVVSIFDIDGKRKQKWVNTGIPTKGNNKRKAQAKLDEILAEYGKDGIDIFKDAYFTDYIIQWLDSMKTAIASSTHASYTQSVNRHILPYFSQRRLKVRDVTPAVIRDYMNSKLETGLSPNTVRKYLFNISKCLDVAVIENIIAVNPVKRVKMPTPIRFTGAKRYNEKQIEQLLEISKGSPIEIVLLLTLFYGLRRSEVLGLRWDAVDFEEKTISIRHTVVITGGKMHKQDRTKNDASNATFPMPDMIMSRLLEWKQQQEMDKALQPNDYHDTGYVCTNPKGELLLPNYVSQHFTAMLKRNNMTHIRFHDLRHSAANFLKSLGFDFKDIQTWLRHKDIQTTMNIYVNLDMEAKGNIADILNDKFQQLEASS